MTTRKIRLTLSSDLYNGIGALVDVDFEDTNLEFDWTVEESAGSGISREFEMNVPAGEYNLIIEYKNDEADDVVENSEFNEGSQDRNLVIENIEYADDGENYVQYDITYSVPANATGILTGREALEGDARRDLWGYPLRVWENATVIIPITFT